MPTALNEQIRRGPRPIPSHSLLYTLPPVLWLTRYQRRQCIFSQREYVLNHIDGDLGLLKYPIRIVISDQPHLFYEVSFEDLFEPTEEVVIAFMYFAENGNNVFRSRTLPHGAFEYIIHSEFKWMEFRMGECPQSRAPL